MENQLIYASILCWEAVHASARGVRAGEQNDRAHRAPPLITPRADQINIDLTDVGRDPAGVHLTGTTAARAVGRASALRKPDA